MLNVRELLRQSFQCCRQFVGLAMVFAGQIEHCADALLHPIQALRIEFSRIELLMQQRCRFVNIDARIVEHSVDFRKFRIEL